MCIKGGFWLQLPKKDIFLFEETHHTNLLINEELDISSLAKMDTAGNYLYLHKLPICRCERLAPSWWTGFLVMAEGQKNLVCVARLIWLKWI